MHSKILLFLAFFLFMTSILPCPGESTQNFEKTVNASLEHHSSPPFKSAAAASSQERILPANETGPSLSGAAPLAEGFLTEESSRTGKVSESAILLFLGFGLITIAGFGRRKPPSR